MRTFVERLLFFACLLILTFAAGVMTGTTGVFPTPHLIGAWEAIKDWEKNWRHYLRLRPELFLVDSLTDVPEFVHDPNRAWPGVTLMNSFLENRPGLRLVDMDGQTIHVWPITYNEIWPNADFASFQRDDWAVAPNGAILLPNGDVVFNMYRAGFARMDRCGQVVWKRPYRGHHAVERTPDGDYWIPGERAATATVRNPHGGTVEIIDPETILRFSEDGHLLEEWDLASIIIDSGYKTTLFSDRIFRFPETNIIRITGDRLTHINDIERLDEDMASAFPMFSSGDLMISLRAINRIMILDGASMRIKWSMPVNYLLPHDPDFMVDGRISLFDNFSTGDIKDSKSASRVITVDPADGTVSLLYQADPPHDFFTATRGSHQNLPNGNILITESNRGRIFEVTPDDREIVWQYANTYSDRNEREFLIGTYQAERYPLSFADFVKQPCDSPL